MRASALKHYHNNPSIYKALTKVVESFTYHGGFEYCFPDSDEMATILFGKRKSHLNREIQNLRKECF